MAEDRLEKLVRRYQKAAEKKDSWGEHWRECYGTAPDAVDQLASSLLAELTPAWAKWFGPRAGSELNETERAQVAPVLEKTTDVMLQNFEHSNFAVEIHQCYLDLVTAGTACLKRLLWARRRLFAFMPCRCPKLPLKKARPEK